MNAADVLTAILHARDKGEDPAMILSEDSPLMDAARDALKPRAPLDATECARALLTLADWHGAPRKTAWGDGMMAAHVMLTKDETMTVYVHRDACRPNAGGNATERSEGRVDHNVGRLTPGEKRL